MHHQSVVGVEKEGNALLSTQTGNIHLQVEQKPFLSFSPPSNTCPSCGEGMCQKACLCTSVQEAVCAKYWGRVFAAQAVQGIQAAVYR